MPTEIIKNYLKTCMLRGYMETEPINRQFRKLQKTRKKEEKENIIRDIELMIKNLK